MQILAKLVNLIILILGITGIGLAAVYLSFGTVWRLWGSDE